jgi:hypothetical protein
MAKNRREAKAGLCTARRRRGHRRGKEIPCRNSGCPLDARQSKQMVVHAHGLRISSQDLR